jgi:hypothetical protein
VQLACSLNQQQQLLPLVVMPTAAEQGEASAAQLDCHPHAAVAAAMVMLLLMLLLLPLVPETMMQQHGLTAAAAAAAVAGGVTRHQE